MNEGLTAVPPRFRSLFRCSLIGFSILILALHICPAGEANGLNRHEFSAPHLGTTAQLVFYSAQDRSAASEVARECFGMIRQPTKE